MKVPDPRKGDKCSVVEQARVKMKQHGARQLGGGETMMGPGGQT